MIWEAEISYIVSPPVGKHAAAFLCSVNGSTLSWTYKKFPGEELLILCHHEECACVRIQMLRLNPLAELVPKAVQIHRSLKPWEASSGLFADLHRNISATAAWTNSIKKIFIFYFRFPFWRAGEILACSVQQECSFIIGRQNLLRSQAVTSAHCYGTNPHSSPPGCSRLVCTPI